MEINTDQLEALLRLKEQQAQNLPKAGAKPGIFDAILSEQMGGEPSVKLGTAAGTLSTSAAQAAMFSQIMLDRSEADNSLDPDAAVLQAAFEQASGALNLWDAYAKSLGSPGGSADLKEAYALLQGIDSQVDRMRQDTAALRQANMGLDSVLNELEILSATEKFKFNRGDYSI